ncbi:TIGR04197 family type VII secretion effector [Lactococcus allomyrinae]|uniref:TIGR04197 family type VII secretion effector n=1 Tax=Lactococcus allomyrinae TaxID=2419773 RepID=A0A387BID8_9LACT|nr:TIGR04197 family type VII secretion effector [Lactococcus allomyrinae]AYG01129.1 TIGR04197 family type VII secretion effector [Lactococcus allomyrinae]
MAAGKIKSNTVDAQEAIAELIGVDASGLSNQSVNFGSSTVPSMLAGQTLSNQLMSDVSKVVSCILLQANKFPELANAIEERDMDAARRWD